MISRSRVRMKDVAEAAGVSVATVSAVLNQRTTRVPVSDATKTKVLEAARRLNYHLNEQARALRQGKSNTIGVVTADITQPFSGQMLRVVESEVHRRNYRFWISDVQNNRQKEKLYLALFMQKQVDGILFLGASNEIEDDGIVMLVENGIPVVLTEREITGRNVPCVMVDNIKGGYLATEHLIGQGHGQVAYITGPPGNIISQQRRAGYGKALQAHDLPCLPDLIAEGGLTLECGYRAMQELLQRLELPAAVFAFNDMVALGAIRAILDRGLQVPEDVAVVGYDDIPMASYSEPPLTTVGQPVEHMCKEGVQTLLSILEGELPRDFCKKTVLEPKLVIRKSCGGWSDRKTCGQERSS